MNAIRRLPFDGEILEAPAKRFEETAVLVHQFGGSRDSLNRHARLFLDLGFDTAVFNLLYHDRTSPLGLLPITADLKFGARHVWSGQIESILNAVPGGKIVFSLSMPSNSAVEAIASRHAEDVRALICDGGPFLRLGECVWNLYTHQYAVRSRVIRAGFTAASLAFYGPRLESDVAGMFARFPRGFPMLSIRAANDKLVSDAAIDEFLAYARRLEVHQLTIGRAGHLEGLKVDEREYRDGIARFLENHVSMLRT